MNPKEAKRYLGLPEPTPMEKILNEIETDFDLKFGVSFEDSKKYEYKKFVLAKIQDIISPIINQISEADYIACEENVLKAETAWNKYCIKTLEDILAKGHGGGNWRRLIISKIEELKPQNKKDIFGDKKPMGYLKEVQKKTKKLKK